MQNTCLVGVAVDEWGSNYSPRPERILDPSVKVRVGKVATGKRLTPTGALC